MTFSLLLQMIVASLSATVIYTFISFIPGTDETSVLMPISMALILSKINPILALTFFVSAVVTLGLLNIVLTLIAGVPGGVLSTPIVEHALILKSNGRTAIGIKKAAVGSLIGVAISLPLSLLIANLVAPYAVFLKNYASWLFILGAIFLSLISKAKILSLISIIPMAILFQGLRSLYWSLGIVPESKTITTSFFLGITVAPLILSLFSLLNKKELDQVTVETPNTTVIPEVSGKDTSLNPLGILNKQELKSASFSSFISTFLFVLSPVGLIILFGELTGKREKTKLGKSESSIVTMSALAQSTYLSGLIISIVALGIPLAPSAIGPGAAFFEAPPVFTIGNTITNQLPIWQLILAFVVGACIAFAIVYCIAMKFATRITRFVMQHVPHEAILALFVALVILLAYLDAGLLNVFGVFLISFACGTLNKLGVNYGIQFMTLYAAPFLLSFF